MALAISTLGSRSIADEQLRCIADSAVPAFHVAPWGDDGNAGTEDAPFATLARARDAMRSDPEIDTTYVRGGTYQLGSTLQLTSQDSEVSFVAYAGETPIISGAQAGLSKLFALNDSDGINLLGLTFRDVTANTHLDGFALDLRNVDGATIADNTFTDTMVAIEMRNSHGNLISGNEMSHIGFIAVEMWNANDNSIVGNHMHNLGEVFAWGGAGVAGYDLKNNWIAHNLVEDSARLGIAIMDGGSHENIGNVIEYNRLLNTVTEVDDSGAIYMLGRSGIDTDTVIRFNYIEDVGSDFSFGIYLDDLSSGVEVYGNFVKNTGFASFMLHGGSNITVENNIAILHDRPIYGYGARMEEHEKFVWEQISPADQNPRLMENIEWSGNIISAPDGLTPDSDYWRRSGGDLAGEPEVTSNLLHNVDAYDGPVVGTPEAGSIFADPLFADPASGDYSLQAASPAFDIGFQPLPYSEMGLGGFTRGSANPVCPPVNAPAQQ